MRQYVSYLTKATPHTWAISSRIWNNGTGGNERDCNSGDQISLKTRASKIANVFRCCTKIRLWRRHRPRSEQAGIFHYGMEGGLRALA